MVKLTPASEQRRDKFFALMKRFIRLGCLLPRRGDFEPERADEYELVLKEMREVQARPRCMRYWPTKRGPTRELKGERPLKKSAGPE